MYLYKKGEIMKLAVLAVLGATLSTAAFGWGDLGHSSVGYIAEKNLTPEGQKFMNSIMGGEPMALSAVWPDHVRDECELPAVPGEQQRARATAAIDLADLLQGPRRALDFVLNDARRPAHANAMGGLPNLDKAKTCVEVPRARVRFQNGEFNTRLCRVCVLHQLAHDQRT